MRIAIVQRDVAQRALIEATLTQCGHTCLLFSDAGALLDALPASAVDLLVLGWPVAELVDPAWFATLRSRCDFRTPMLFVSPNRSDESMLRAFSAGADDYVGLPVDPAVLCARVHALLRRAFPERCPSMSHDTGPYRFWAERQVVTLHDREVQLSGTQYRLASLFFGNIGRPLSRDHIYVAVWGRELPGMTRTIDSHVSRLRAVLQIGAPNGFTLQPVYKTGYLLLRVDADIRASA